MADQSDPGREFARFVKGVEPRLSHAFFAAYGPDVGADVTAEALEYAWEHWDRIRKMTNPAGYLFRVGQSKARWYHRPAIAFPHVSRLTYPFCEPGLPAALESLTKNQRLAVVLVYALEWTEQETADLIGRSRSTIRTHLERGLANLRAALGETIDA
jgi:RNA polymerase sigma-70 factor (ECF subfamily)